MMHGLTLIEVLVYMALLSFLLFGVYTMNLAITTATSRIHTETQILSEGIFISELIKDAAYQNQPTVYAGDDSLRLSDGVAFRRVGDVLWYDYRSTSQQLTYTPIALTEFVSTVVSSTSTPSYIEVSFRLSNEGVSRMFSTFIYP